MKLKDLLAVFDEDVAFYLYDEEDEELYFSMTDESISSFLKMEVQLVGFNKDLEDTLDIVLLDK